MIKSPQATMYWETDGSVSECAVANYEAIAAGGADMVILGGGAWDRRRVSDRDTYPGQEWGAEGALTIDEAAENAQALEKEGLNYISVNGYGYGLLPFKYCSDYWPYPEPEEHMKPYLEQYKGQGILIPCAYAIQMLLSFMLVKFIV